MTTRTRSVWLSVFALLLCGMPCAQIALTEPLQNPVASGLEGKWDLCVMVTQRLHGTKDVGFAAPVEFASDASLASNLPFPKFLLGAHVYMTGYMKTPGWKRPCVLFEKDGFKVLTFSGEGREAQEANSFEIFFATAKNKVDSLVFIREAMSREPFVVLENNARYHQPSQQIASQKSPDEQKERWYLCKIGPNRVGHLRVKKNENNDGIIFTHVFTTRYRDTEVVQNLLTYCKDDSFYSPQQIFCRAQGGRDALSFIARIGQDRILRSRLGRNQIETFVPASTVFGPIFLELIPKLPFADKTLHYSLLEPEDLIIRENCRVDYMGKETVDISGEKKELDKFTVDAGVDNYPPPSHYWVNERKVVERFVLPDDREFILTDQENATEGY